MKLNIENKYWTLPHDQQQQLPRQPTIDFVLGLVNKGSSSRHSRKKPKNFLLNPAWFDLNSGFSQLWLSDES